MTRKPHVSSGFAAKQICTKLTKKKKTPKLVLSKALGYWSCIYGMVG